MARELVVRIVGDAKDLDRVFSQSARSAEGFGAKVGNVGTTLTKTLTPAAAGIALIGRKAFEEWDSGMDALRAGTGATGKDLGRLVDSMKKVGGQVPASFGQIGQVMADLKQRTGASGVALEQLTTKMLNLSRITGTDARANVAALTRLFGDWSIKTGEQAGTLDKLYRASQTTGIGVTRLSELMVQFGSPLRQLGLDFDTTAAMFARFEKEGVNIETAMPGLRMALKNFAKDGREPAKALAETIEQIKNAATTAEANTIAFKTFGVRAGPDLAAAIREGRFDLDALITKMRDGKETVDAAAKDTLDLSDKFTMLKNRVFAAIGPYGEFLQLVGGGLAALGPTLMGLGSLSGALGKIGQSAGGAGGSFGSFTKSLITNPITLAVGAAVALTGGMYALSRAVGTSREAFERAETAARNYKAALDTLTQSSRGLEDAHTRVERAEIGVARARQHLTTFTTPASQKTIAYKEAVLGLEEAETELRRAHEDETTAQRAATAASANARTKTMQFSEALDDATKKAHSMATAVGGLGARQRTFMDTIRIPLYDSYISRLQSIAKEAGGSSTELGRAAQKAAALTKEIAGIPTYKRIDIAIVKTIYEQITPWGGGPKGRAAGGPVLRGVAYIVGEKGPELFVPDVGGAIIPEFVSLDTKRMSALRSASVGGGGDLTVEKIEVHVHGDANDPAAVARRIAPEIIKELRKQRLRSGSLGL